MHHHRRDANWYLHLSRHSSQAIPTHSTAVYKDLVCTLLREQAIFFCFLDYAFVLKKLLSRKNKSMYCKDEWMSRQKQPVQDAGP